jgi:uncharacterized protein YecE (DUF72 family)
LAKKGRDVYIYFNNDAEGHAVKNALTLMEMIPNKYFPNIQARTSSTSR